jgi:hypothetical protein
MGGPLLGPHEGVQWCALLLWFPLFKMKFDTRYAPPVVPGLAPQGVPQVSLRGHEQVYQQWPTRRIVPLGRLEVVKQGVVGGLLDEVRAGRPVTAEKPLDQRPEEGFAQVDESGRVSREGASMQGQKACGIVHR